MLVCCEHAAQVSTQLDAKPFQLALRSSVFRYSVIPVRCVRERVQASKTWGEKWDSCHALSLAP